MTSAPSPLRLALYCTGCIPGYQLPCFAGAARDIYRHHGLSVEIVDPDPGPANVLSVAAGRYDMCLTSVAHFLGAKTAAPDIDARFIFMLARKSHMAAFVVDGRVASHGGVISTHADLDGASILGADDSAFVKEYLAFLTRIDARPGPLVPERYEQILPALLAGRADVAADFVDLHPRFQAEADAAGARIAALPFHEAGVDIYGSGLVCAGRLLRESPELVRAAVGAFHEAVMLSREDPFAGLDVLVEHVPSANPDLVVAGWETGSSLIFDAAPNDGPLGTMDSDKWRRTLAFHADAYGVPGNIDPGSLYENSALRAGSRA